MACELLPVPSLSLHPALEPLTYLCSMQAHESHWSRRGNSVQVREGSQGAMLLHAGGCSSAPKDPSGGRGHHGQLVMAVGAGVFEAGGVLGCKGNVTLLLNIVADASMRAFSSE